MKKTSLLLLPLVLSLLLLAGCAKEKERIYEINTVEALPADANKDILKSDEQFISVLYANLFQKALSANELVEISKVIQSVGDKETIHEVVLSNFMNKPGKIIPTDADMRADVDQFIDDTYARFLVRQPTAAEKTWFRNFIESDPKVTPEIVYMSFALSDEYQYY